MFDSKLQEPKYTGSNMAANGWPGRAHEVGVVWAMLGEVFSCNFSILENHVFYI